MKIAASITPNKTKFGPLLFPGEVERGCKYLHEVGYDAIELSLRTKDDIDAKTLNRILSTNHLDLVAIATGQSYIEDDFSLYNGDNVLRDNSIKRICAHIDLAAEFNAGVIIGGIRGVVKRKEYFSIYKDLGEQALCTCAEYAQIKKVTLLLEPVNRYETNIINTVADAQDVINRNSLQSVVKILPDAYHMNIEEQDLPATLLKNRDSIGAFHCSDSNRLAPGLGHIDFKTLLAQLKTSTECRYLGVEILPLPSSEEAAFSAIQTIKTALQN